jgi:hypothetical protein
MKTSFGVDFSTSTILRHARVWLLASLAAASVQAIAQHNAGQDPSGRVGRVSMVDGQLWIKDVQGNEQFNGTVNWPVANGTALETGMNSRAEVRVGSNTYRFAPDTKAQFIELSDRTTRINVEHGSVALRFKSGESARDNWVQTQTGVINFTEAGRYRVDVDYDRVSFAVAQGQAQMSTQTNSFGVRSGGRMEVDSRGSARNTELFADNFDEWVRTQDRRDDARPAPRYVSREMSGYEVLEDNGYWNDVAGYGAVWYPRVVVADWAPYRYGHWTHLNPWGWTWVDDAPWGFAVTHYGRWGWIGGRWGWVPGAIVPRPVWAPALVAWGGGSNWNWSVSVGAPSYGWVPLAPAEVYVPWYNVSPRYCHSLNYGHVHNVTVINNYYSNPGSQAFANVQVAGAVSAATAGASFANRTVGSTLGTTAGSMARAAAAAQYGTPSAQQGAVIQQPGRGISTIKPITDVNIAAAAFNQHRIVAPASVTQPNVAAVPIRVTAPAMINNPAAAAAQAAAAAASNNPARVNQAPAVVSNAPGVSPNLSNMPQSGRPLPVQVPQAGAAAVQAQPVPRDNRDNRDNRDPRIMQQEQQRGAQEAARAAAAQQQAAQAQVERRPGRGEWRGVDPRQAQREVQTAPQPSTQATPLNVPQAQPQAAPQDPRAAQREAQAAAREAARAQHDAERGDRRDRAERPQPRDPRGEARPDHGGDKVSREELIIRRMQER